MNVKVNNFRFVDSFIGINFISFLVVYSDGCVLLVGWFPFS